MDDDDEAVTNVDRNNKQTNKCLDPNPSSSNYKAWIGQTNVLTKGESSSG